jgi:hypothetical protein
LAGNWKWTSKQDIKFVNTVEWANSTTYTITVPAGTVSISGYSTEFDWETLFDTPTNQVYKISPSERIISPKQVKNSLFYR